MPFPGSLAVLSLGSLGGSLGAPEDKGVEADGRSFVVTEEDSAARRLCLRARAELFELNDKVGWACGLGIYRLWLGLCGLGIYRWVATSA